MPETKRIPFRWFQLKYVDMVFPVSKMGENYLSTKYPNSEKKIRANYLGINQFADCILNTEHKFTIVSCSIISNFKRVYQIPEILKNISFPVKWVHFGSILETESTTELFKKNLNDLLLNHKNVEVNMLGEIKNEDVYKFYQSNSINVFLSLSETEGLPVSMMEAIGAGIPIIATNVGGCKEIVTDISGILIPKEFDAKMVAKIISDFKYSNKNTIEFRKNAQEFCKKNFDLVQNFNQLNSTINSFYN